MQLCVPGEFDHLHCKFTLLLMYKLHEIESKSVILPYTVCNHKTHNAIQKIKLYQFWKLQHTDTQRDL